MTIQKPHNTGHYWRLKREEAILKIEAKKRADCIRDMEHDWARLKGKLAKITKVLAPFDDTYRDIEIEGLDNGR